MQNVWLSPSCLRPCLSQTIDHHRAEKGPLGIIYTTQQRQFLHNDRRIRNGKMCAVWPYHSESHSYGCLNNAHKLIWLWCARNNELLSSFCFVSGNTLRVNLCRPKNFVLSILCLTWLTHAISHALFQLSKDHDRTIFAFKNATKN